MGLKQEQLLIAGVLVMLLLLTSACQLPFLSPSAPVARTAVPTPSPTPAPASVAGATKNYFGLTSGRRLVYRRHGGSFQHVEISGPDKTIWPGHLLWRLRSNFSPGSPMPPITELEEVNGDHLVLAGTIKSTGMHLYNPPYLLLKAPPIVGDMYTTLTGLADGTTTNITITYHVLARDSLTVAAGSYLAYRLEYTRVTQLSDGSSSTLQLLEWFVPKVGIVKVASSTNPLYNAELVSAK